MKPPRKPKPKYCHMIVAAAQPNAKANPVWERLMNGVQAGMQKMTKNIQVAQQKKSVEAAIEICADSQALAGSVLEAGAAIPFALNYDHILDTLQFGCAVVLDIASSQPHKKEAEIVRNYARNIGMRLRIVEKLSQSDRPTALTLADEYRQRLERGLPAQLEDMCRDAERIAAPRR